MALAVDDALSPFEKELALALLMARSDGVKSVLDDRDRRRRVILAARNGPQSKYALAKIAAQEVLVGRPRPDLCEVCKSPSRSVVFDHDHTTGKFRGWLCNH